MSSCPSLSKSPTSIPSRSNWFFELPDWTRLEIFMSVVQPYLVRSRGIIAHVNIRKAVFVQITHHDGKSLIPRRVVSGLPCASMNVPSVHERALKCACPSLTYKTSGRQFIQHAIDKFYSF